MLTPPPKIEEIPDIPFTQEAYEKMELELERLTKLRAEVMIRLQTAREMGDLSENGAYIYAKFELGSLTRQLSQLRHLLKHGKVVEKSGKGIIEFGTTVTLQQGEKQVQYTLVSFHESNLKENKLSLESPLGQSLAGHKVGDVIFFETPKGKATYTILKIE